MALSDLPVELLDTIFEPLAASSLATLARTSHHLKPSASRLLYRHLVLSSVTRNLAAVNSLASGPHLSSLVRKFAITIQDGADIADPKYYVRLSQAMQSMKDITSLEVHIDAGLSWAVAAFLAQTPALRSLQLAAECPTCVPLSPSAIPHLTSYTGPPNVLRQLLPSRPLVSLHLSGDLTLDDIDHFTDAPTPTVSTPTAHDRLLQSTPGTDTIEALSTVTSAHPVLVVEALAEACPNLVSLQVLASYAFWQAPDIAFCTRIGQALSHLPRLLSFELSGMHWEFRPKVTLTPNGTCIEKEWMSPPVTPRLDAQEGLAGNADWEFDEAFMEWAY